MAFTVISTNQTTQQIVNGSDEVILLEGVSVASSATAFLGSHDTTMSVFIYGSVASSAITIDLGALPGDTSPLVVYVGETGTVLNTFRFGRSAISIKRFDADIVNHGDITSSGVGISFETGVTAGNVTNTGALISTGSVAISVSGSIASTSGTFNFSNSGQISGQGNGILVFYQSVELFNSGIISGDTGISIFNNTGQTNALNVHNTGTIIGNSTNAITGDASSDTVTNSGHIIGNIRLYGGNDTFNGTGGRVDGTVHGGTGDDTYIIDDANIDLVENAAEGTDTVKATVSFRLGDNFENLTLLTHKNINGVGNSLDNTLTGNAGNNRLQGDQGNDLINGAHGDDKLLGSFGNDTLQGGKGDDILKGGLDNDLLQMGNGDDFGYGGKGNDTLEGARGDDTLKGGTGQDILTGGLGDDVFLFTRKAHSTTVSFDTITDFTSGEDLIDLSAFNGTFDFIGNTAFSGTAKEVRFFSVGADRTVKIDVDGDGSADMTILVNSATALVELDFVL